MKLLIALSILIGSLLSGSPAPEESALAGEWGYTGNRFVFTEAEGATPDPGDVDARLKAMGASRTGCVLTLTADHKGSLRLGGKSIDFNWALDRNTKEFKSMIGPFTIKGWMVRDGKKIVLVYTRTNLFTIIRYLCNSTGRKEVAPLGAMLDRCRGLTLGMEFERN